MLIDILMLFASAGLGQATSECRQWAQKKAGERNHDIENALLKAHERALQEIRAYCQQNRQWERVSGTIIARLDRLTKDGKVILHMVEEGQSPGSAGSLAPVDQQDIASRLMQRLESEHHWLREAPPMLLGAFRGLYLPQLVHYFRVEIKHNPVVFNTLTHDLLAQTGKQVANIDQQLQEISARVDDGVDAFIASCEGLDRRFDELLKTLTPPQPVPADFATLIEDKTAEFIGREFVFAEIEQFFQQESKGYFIIEADPGVGKTALLAEYVRRNGCIAYFNILSEGRSSAKDFLESVCGQLIQRYGLNYDLPLHPDNTSNGNFLSKLLTEVSAQSGGVKIAVDALDEVDWKNQPQGVNVLYLPATLPNGVYFILTKRPENLPLMISAPHQEFDLMAAAYLAANLQDIQKFIRYRAQRPQVQQWIAQLPEPVTVEEFTAVLAENSDNNFMYLKYVLDDIEAGKYANLNLDSLPKGLEKYYQQHWQRMGMETKPLPRTKLKIIYLLSKTRKPVSCDLLADFVKEDALTVQEVLDEWEQFLQSRSVNGNLVYRIYHKSFQDFLSSQETVKKAGVNLGDIEKEITDNLWDDLYGNP